MYGYGAPTHGQAKRIAWKDLKKLVPEAARSGRPSESDLFIPLWHGGGIKVTGLDEPARVEGSPWDHFVLDEYGNMHPEVWGEHLRPALADRNGSCDLIGVPEGRNHYYDIAEFAKAEYQEHGAASEWAFWHWLSADILPQKEIDAAKHDMDPLTFDQEFGGSFVTFQGRVYYGFSDAHKLPLRKLYEPTRTLVFCMDFNVSPGIAVVVQEMTLATLPTKAGQITAIIGEVHIPNNSNTRAVCAKLLTDWGNHQGLVEVFGDATGGQEGTAKVTGTDWDLIRRYLRDGVDDIKGFGGRVTTYVKPGNPRERARVNAVNSRIEAADKTKRLFADPKHAPMTIKDLEGVRTLKGGSGEIDKKSDKKLTHWTDALGYYIEYRFPVADGAWKPVTVKF